MGLIDAIRAPLFVPADRPDRFEKAAASGADAVILDLEDAVAPGAKARARAALTCAFTELPIIVRINAARTPWHDEDVAALQDLPIAGVMLPKSEGPEAITRVAAALGDRRPIIALIETARGLAEARRIAALAPVTRLAFGSVDYCADLGMEHRRDALLPARVELVLASRLAGIAAALDGVTTRLDDPDLAEDDARHARALGLTGKLCIHPRQVAPVLRAFTPTEAECDWARRVLATGNGAVSMDGAMVDEPVRIRACAILAVAHSDCPNATQNDPQ